MALQIGFIGAGSVARRHSAILRDMADVQITAFCDANSAKASALATRFGARAFTSPERMFRSLKFDAIYICVPATAHGVPENLAVKNGCALFIEPPIAAHIRTATAISNNIRKNGALVCVGSAWRYSDNIDRAKKLLRPHRALSFSLISGQWSSEISTQEENGSIWLEAWPLFDQLRFLTGESKRLIGIENSEKMAGSLLIENKAGVSANISALRKITGSQKQDVEFSESSYLKIIRDDGELNLNFSRCIHNLGSLILQWRSEEETLQFDSGQRLDYLQNLAFLRAVTQGKRTEIRSNYSEAIKTLKLALAAQRSMGSTKFLEI
jgi:predicted dehydrogenase